MRVALRREMLRLVHKVLLAASLLAFAACASRVTPDDAADVHGTTDAIVNDSGRPSDAPPDRLGLPVDVVIEDAPAIDSCAPMRVSFPVCGAACDGPGRWFWDGDRCVNDGCHQCEGVDCSAQYESEDTCMRAHTTCRATICRATGGHWMPVGPFQECGDYICGRSNERECFVPFAGCDCGPGRTYRDGVGCEIDASCTPQDLCRATGGTIESGCPFHCGQSLECPVLGMHCNCGPAMNFDDARGCVPASDCPPSDDTLCAATGGSWEAICCPSHCGMPCPEPCVNPACRCRPDQMWIAGRGCVMSEECTLGAPLEWCRSANDCSAGLACCGGACAAPCCGTGCGADGCPAR